MRSPDQSSLGLPFSDVSAKFGERKKNYWRNSNLRSCTTTCDGQNCGILCGSKCRYKNSKTLSLLQSNPLSNISEENCCLSHLKYNLVFLCTFRNEFSIDCWVHFQVENFQILDCWHTPTPQYCSVSPKVSMSIKFVHMMLFIVKWFPKFIVMISENWEPIKVLMSQIIQCWRYYTICAT